MALEVVDQSVRSSAVDIICVDSVAALVPRAEIEGEMGAHQGGVLPDITHVMFHMTVNLRTDSIFQPMLDMQSMHIKMTTFSTHD